MLLTITNDDVEINEDREAAFEDQMKDVLRARKLAEIRREEHVLAEREHELELQVRRAQERCREWSVGEVLAGLFKGPVVKLARTLGS